MKNEKMELFGVYTDEDWIREDNIRKLYNMTINWKEINGKWNEVAEKKMQEVSMRDSLTINEKALLWQIGYYEAKNKTEKEKFNEVKTITSDFENFLRKL